MAHYVVNPLMKSAYVMGSSMAPPQYGGNPGYIGQEYLYGDTAPIATYMYRLWGYISGEESFPWGDGITISGASVYVYIGTAHNMELPFWETTGTVSVCVPDRKFSYDLGDAQAYSVMSSAVEFATCPTGKGTTIAVTDMDLLKKILTYGVVLRAKTNGWYAMGCSVASIYYDYTDVNAPPVVSNVRAPLSAFLCDDIPITWSYSQSSDVPQSRVDIELYEDTYNYKVIAHGVSAPGNQYTASLRDIGMFPQEAFPDLEWKIRIRAYSTASDTPGEWAYSGRIYLKNITAVPVSPKGGENRIATEPIDLVWKLLDYPTGKPYGFRVNWSADGGETWTGNDLLYDETDGDGTTWRYTVPADTLPHGVVRWEVLGYTIEGSYNIKNIIVETFTAVIQASTSAVSCDGKPMPTLSWKSTAQAAFQVRFADYDSGAVYGADTSFRVPYAYADGLYPVQVRTQAATGEWSAWTEREYVQITNIPPMGDMAFFHQKITKTARTVKIDWIYWDDYQGYILYRDGVPIYTGTEGTYIDAMASGKTEYFVRAITPAGYYAQSDTMIVDATPDVDCMYCVDSGEWMSLVYSAEPRRRQFSQNSRVSYRYYSGRPRPIAFSAGETERTGTFSYCFRDIREAEKLEKMSGKEVIVRGTDGSLIRGILNGVMRTTEILHDVSFSVTEIDYEERVPYAIT